MKIPAILFLGMTFIALSFLTAKEMELKNQDEKISYSVGYQIGGDFKHQGVAFNSEALIRGIEDAFVGGRPLLSEEEMRTTLIDLKKKIVDGQVAKNKHEVAQIQEEGSAYLVTNANKESVIVLPSGLQYKVIKAGTGKKPTPEDRVTVHYQGTRVDDREFGSTYRTDMPDTMELAQVISGWQEALPMMAEGAKGELYIPASLAFQERGPLEGHTVILEVELLSVEPKQ